MYQLLKTITRRTSLGLALAAMALPSLWAHDGPHDLEAILKDRPAGDQARDQFRHPKETLEFFGLKPGMTVADALPGSWYGRILMPYLGTEGTYVGVAYSLDVDRHLMGDRFESRKEELLAFPKEFPGKAESWSDVSPHLIGMLMDQAPAELDGKLDIYFFFRALHHLNRFEPELLDKAAGEAFRLIKAGGVAAIVQHRASEEADDDWAGGHNGYLKESRVIEAFTKAGFVLEAKSEINANPKDKPTTSEFVWRLLPALAGPDEVKEKNRPIGESDRMTLKFRKPAAH